MTAPLVVVTGTGTGIGKTHVTAALLVAWARLLRDMGVERPAVAGLKPVESGVSAGAPTDAQTLDHASTFHVKQFAPPYVLARAVSPHLAAAEEERIIDLEVIRAYVAEVREAAADGVAVELPGGLFSPLARELDNADVLRALAPEVVLLVVPDRLGVLHDVAAATRAAAACRAPITGIIVVTPDRADASTGTNAVELGVVTRIPVLATLPRADVTVLAAREDLAAVLGALLRKPPKPLRP